MPTTGKLAALIVILLLLAALAVWQFGGSRSDSETTDVEAPEPRATASEQTAEKSATEREAVRSDEEAKPEAAAAAATGILRVRVVYGDDDTPAADVRVGVSRRIGPGRIATWKFARTDAQGAVRFAELPPGKTIVQTDRREEWHDASVVAGKETELTITLEGGVDIRGVVVDTADAAVPGATIVLAGWGGSGPRTMGETDAEGRFALRQVERLSNVGARAKGFAPSPLRSVSAGAGAKVDVRIVLPGAGGSVVGRVVDRDGDPVADARLRLGKAPSPGLVIQLPDGADGMGAPRVRARTDANGEFRAEGIPAGEQPVSVKAAEFASWQGSVRVVAHTDNRLDITLARGVTLTGTVRDEKGQTVPKVDLTISRKGERYHRSTRSRADGSFRVAAITPGPFELHARHRTSGRATAKLQGRAGETVQHDVQLSRGLVFQGLVRGRDGKPLDEVRVEATGRWKRRQWNHYEFTKADGRFALIGCPPGPTIHLRLQRRGYATLDRMKLDATTGPSEFTMTWEGEPTARIVGRVLDPDGKPVGDAEISNPRAGDGNSAAHTAKADGSIEITKLRPGTYTVIVKARSYPQYVSKRRTLASGETWDLGTVQFAHGGRLRLKSLSPASQRFYAFIYHEDGRFADRVYAKERSELSAPLNPGKYVLRITGRTVVPKILNATVRRGEETVVPVPIESGSPTVLQFEMPPNTNDVYRLRYVIRGPDGLAFDRELSRWRPSRFHNTHGLKPGRHSLHATTSKGHAGELEFEVRKSEKLQTVRVRLR